MSPLHSDSKEIRRRCDIFISGFIAHEDGTRHIQNPYFDKTRLDQPDEAKLWSAGWRDAESLS